MAYMPNVIIPATASAALNSRWPKISSGTNASFLPRAPWTNSALATTNTAASARMAGEVNPQCGPSMVAKDRAASAATASICPTGSRRRPFGSLDSGTPLIASAMAATLTGTTRTKMLRQPAASTSRPPTVGPTASARPLQPAQMPIALARCLASV
jgi:hypothetical protein